MSHKKITSTDSPIGEREYKSMLPVGSGKSFREISDHTVRKIKRIVYPFLELPGRHNLQWTSTEILDVVVQAGKRNTCLEYTVNSLNLLKPRIVRGIAVPSAPTSDTVFNRAKKVDTREWIERYEEANRKLLESAVKARVFRGWVDLAIDIHDIPFYGKKNTRGIVGTKRKLGTNYAFRYMTVCVTAQKDKYTLSATPMTQLSSTPKTLGEMLEKALKYIDGHIGVTYVDRGFFSVPCIKTFEKLDLKYLMPAIKNTKIRKIIKETRDYPVVMPYTFGSRNKTVDMTLILVETVKEKGKERKKEVYAFATNLTVDVEQVEKLCELYRNRWTVETSYRMLGEVRTKTTCKDFSVRWFFVLFGLLIRNGYYLFNAVVIEYGHVTLMTFAELIVEFTEFEGDNG
jgi:hypothetical protein